MRMNGSDSVFEEFSRYSGYMEQAFDNNRFDAFRQLSMERFALLKRSPAGPERQRLAELFREDTVRWVPRIKRRMSQRRIERSQWNLVTGGVLGPRRKSGRMVNEVG